MRNSLVPLVVIYVPSVLMAVAALATTHPEAKTFVASGPPWIRDVTAGCATFQASFCQSHGGLGFIALLLLLEPLVLGWEESSLRHYLHDRSVRRWHDLSFVFLLLTGLFARLVVVYSFGLFYVLVLAWDAIARSLSWMAVSTQCLPLDVFLFYRGVSFLEVESRLGKVLEHLVVLDGLGVIPGGKVLELCEEGVHLGPVLGDRPGEFDDPGGLTCLGGLDQGMLIGLDLGLEAHDAGLEGLDLPLLGPQLLAALPDHFTAPLAQLLARRPARGGLGGR